MILSIDPGKRHAGLALFKDSRLYKAWLVKGDPTYAKAVGNWGIATAQAVSNDLFRNSYPGVLDVCVIERPQIYPGTSTKISNDCVDLAIVGGAIAGIHATQIEIVHFYLPREWKGQVEKKAMNNRTQGRLNDEELSKVKLPKHLARQTDVWDAVGIGLKYVGRL